MRKGFDGLSGLVRNELHQNPLSGDVFIFINKRGNQIKLLLWEGDGFSLYYKRLERGTYELPTVANKGGSLALRNDELTLILQGISLRSVQRRKRYKIIDKNVTTEQATA
jgi:transposase